MTITRRFEVRPSTSAQRDPERAQLVWPASSSETGTLSASDDPWLTGHGPLPPACVDLVRVSFGAYAADRLSPRGQSFARRIDLLVHGVEGEAWRAPLVSQVVQLLGWLTTDEWTIEVVNESGDRPAAQQEMRFEDSAGTIALLSGGLDSLCGAVLADRSERRVHVGHHNSPTGKHPQDAVRRWLTAQVGREIDYVQLRASQRPRKREASTRTRSLMFLALAAATAQRWGFDRVEVPENGYTSLNPPLGPARYGALSTRSTHPTTLVRANELFDALHIDVRVGNPYEWMTKGELVAAAASAATNLAEGVEVSMSCSKPMGHLFGGSSHQNCGLCVPCVVRRASVAAAGVEDRTPYLVETLPPEKSAALARARRRDIAEVRRAARRPLRLGDIVALGPFPEDYAFDEAVDLANRGLRELALVKLPDV